MKIPRLFIHAAAAAGLILMSGVTTAVAAPDGLSGPVLECLQDCRGLHRSCLHGCNAAMADCMSGPRVEMRICRYECSTEFEAETPELDACIQDCRESILAPAFEECRARRRDCTEQCLPGRCWRICRPDGPGLDETDACIGGCAADLLECARSDRVALHECLEPCREIIDIDEKLACAGACADAAVGNAEDCVGDYAGCIEGCQPSPTTTVP